jgi:hypothetical protein
VIKKYCKNCGKPLKGNRRKYCNPSCKTNFYTKRRLRRIQLMGPERYIREQLDNKKILLQIDDKTQVKITINIIREELK